MTFFLKKQTQRCQTSDQECWVRITGWLGGSEYATRQEYHRENLSTSLGFRLTWSYSSLNNRNKDLWVGVTSGCWTACLRNDLINTSMQEQIVKFKTKLVITVFQEENTIVIFPTKYQSCMPLFIILVRKERILSDQILESFKIQLAQPFLHGSDRHHVLKHMANKKWL